MEVASRKERGRKRAGGKAGRAGAKRRYGLSCGWVSGWLGPKERQETWQNMGATTTTDDKRTATTTSDNVGVIHR